MNGPTPADAARNALAAFSDALSTLALAAERPGECTGDTDALHALADITADALRSLYSTSGVLASIFGSYADAYGDERARRIASAAYALADDALHYPPAPYGLPDALADGTLTADDTDDTDDASITLAEWERELLALPPYAPYPPLSESGE